MDQPLQVFQGTPSNILFNRPNNHFPMFWINLNDVLLENNKNYKQTNKQTSPKIFSIAS